MTTTSDSMKRLVDLAGRHDLAQFEDAWVETIAGDVSDVDGLLEAISGLESQGQFRKAAQYLSLLLPSYLDHGRNEEALKVLKRLASIDPREKGVRSGLLKVIREKYADHPGLEQLMVHAGVETERDIAAAVDKLEAYLHFAPGAYVEHPAGWGVGTVASIDAEEATVTIDFAEMQGHEISMDMATNITKPLTPDHFKAMKFDRIEELHEMAEKDQVALVKLAVTSRERQTTVRDLRGIMTEGVIPTKDWSKWWNKARTKVKRDPNVKFSTGNNPVIEVTQAEQSFEDTTLNHMGSLKNLPARVKYVRGLFNELEAHPETRDAIIVAAGVLAKSAQESSAKHPGAILSVALMLEKVCEIDESFAVPDEFTVAHVLEDPWRVLELLDTVPITADRKILLGRLKDTQPDLWPEIYERAMYIGENDIGDYCLKELQAVGAFDRLTRVIFEIHKKFRDYRSSFMWYVKVAVAGKLHQALPATSLGSLLEKTMLLHTHVANRFFQTEDAAYRKEFKAIEKMLQARNYDFARKTLKACEGTEALSFYNMVRQSRSLPDDVKDGMVAAILRTRPEVAKEAAAAREADSDSIWDDRTIYVSSAGYLRYENEFNKLVNEDIPENAREIGRAASYGDLSENAEWAAAVEKQSQLTRKAEEMRAALEKARVIDESMISDDTVAVGCRVTVDNKSTGKTETYVVLGPWDADTEKGIISYLSPLGKGLLGLKVGDETTVELPAGNHDFVVNAIEAIEFSELESATQ